MLATANSYHAYTPLVSSPLTPYRHSSLRSSFEMRSPCRSASVSDVPPISRSSSTRRTLASSSPLKGRNTRPIQSQTRDALAEKRRAAFAARIQRDRSERRWSVRADDIARLDHRIEQRRWEEEQLRNAPETRADYEVEDELEEECELAAVQNRTIEQQMEDAEAAFLEQHDGDSTAFFQYMNAMNEPMEGEGAQIHYEHQPPSPPSPPAHDDPDDPFNDAYYGADYEDIFSTLVVEHDRLAQEAQERRYAEGRRIHGDNYDAMLWDAMDC